jgi:ammonia channel protein AmtB
MLIFATTSTVNAGDNAWVLVSAALVLVMCIPGLFLFYGGLVRSKNVLSIAAQCLALTAMGILMWWASDTVWSLAHPSQDQISDTSLEVLNTSVSRASVRVLATMMEESRRELLLSSKQCSQPSLPL